MPKTFMLLKPASNSILSDNGKIRPTSFKVTIKCAQLSNISHPYQIVRNNKSYAKAVFF